MDQHSRALKGLQSTTMRRLRNTPGYILLVWRWGSWLYVLIVTLLFRTYALDLAIKLLIFTFFHTLIVTLYAPVLQVLLPNLPRLSFLRLPQRPPAEDEEPDILTPLVQTRNRYWNFIIYGSDVIICGIVMYLGGTFGDPPFGAGSFFYRYGISTAFAAAFAYGYRGALVASLGYDVFSVLGMIHPPPGSEQHVVNIVDIAGSLIDTPLAALLCAYLASLIASHTRSRRREQDNARTQHALVRVGETLLRGIGDGHDRQRLLEQSVAQIRQGGHFQRLVIALIGKPSDSDHEESEKSPTEMTTCVASEVSEDMLPDQSASFISQVIHSGQELHAFEKLHARDNYGIARLYLPIFKDEQVQLVLGAESRRQTPFPQKRVEFLLIAGAQLLVALDNIRLAEQTVQLAATAERGRIAREIHDGIAQLVYMLSLNAETSATQARRIAEASEEDAELLNPLAERLERLVTISKQALWETRNYMFSLKPLMSGSLTLSQMLANQLREFEAISGLSTQLEIEGDEARMYEERRRARKYAQAGAAIFRITQEALSNVYKHAAATLIQVHLRYTEEQVELNIRDNGHGLQVDPYKYDLASDGGRVRIYSGHGLQGMRERAQELGGSLEIASPQTGGVHIYTSIPVT